MNVLDLAYEAGLSPKRCASTNGGEYKSKCPNCQSGIDRFCIWPSQKNSGQYWCRVCEVKGDAIQFCRDFLRMTFQQACQKMNFTPQISAQFQSNKKSTFGDYRASLPFPIWQKLAKSFINYSHKNLMGDRHAIRELEKRGFNIESIKQFYLGWNPKNLFDQRERWGFIPEIKQNGSPRRQWLPEGIVIPSFEEGNPTKIKIRRSDWFSEDTLPKYVEISGSKPAPSVYGARSKPVIIVESELDALLIQQEASHLVCCVALGGVSKKPDVEMHTWLKQAPLILLSLDFDAAGKKKFGSWMRNYSNLHPWPAPYPKSPGDAFQISSMNIFKWAELGILN